MIFYAELYIILKPRKLLVEIEKFDFFNYWKKYVYGELNNCLIGSINSDNLVIFEFPNFEFDLNFVNN